MSIETMKVAKVNKICLKHAKVSVTHLNGDNKF